MTLSRTMLLRHFQLFQPQPDTSSAALFGASEQSFRQAAVLIGFVEHPEGLSVILTKRAQHLRHHPGQISFPGGKHEPQDQSIYDTALREADEEIGLKSQWITPFGHLPAMRTVTQFEVTPVLGFVSPDYQVVSDTNEVDDVFEVPLSFLLNPHHIHRYTFQRHQRERQIFAMLYQDYFIWGVTAQMIHALHQHLMPTPVNSIEQFQLTSQSLFIDV